MNSIRNRFILIGFLTLLAAYLVAPTVVYFSLPKSVRNDSAELQKRLPDWLPKKHIKLGLDLQGGVQLVLGVDTAVAVDNKLARVGTELTRWANETKPQVESAYVVKGQQKLRVVLAPGVDAGTLRGQIAKEFPGLKPGANVDRQVDFSYDDTHMKQIRDSALEQAERVVRSRIDKWGVAEPSISRRADKSILVQLPGFKEPEKARELLGRTAQLKFKMEDEQFKGFESLINQLPEGVTHQRRGNHGVISLVGEDKQKIVELAKPMIPEGRELHFEEEKIAGGKKTIYHSHVLMASTEISGEDILDANVTYDSNSMDSRPAVSLKFTGTGGKEFAEVTGANIGNRMAIVLDDVVISDPVINSRISGGNAQITLGSGKGYNDILEEANQLALVLKSGALPAPITILEERQVGATLGPELANQGVMSVLIGLVFVFVFIVAYYRGPGMVACIVLSLNALFLLALMALFGFSLTLPGFAGFVLTLGMAVDSNVLINERIRQELGEGRTARKAVENGFDKVLWTIIDANVTTLIAALVLLETNSGGPIKGFAITLIIGLLVSLFTALFCTRTFFMKYISGDRSEEQMKKWLGAFANNRKVGNFDFLKLGRLVTFAGFALSIAVIGVGATKGINWAVDFAGGTEMEVIFGKPIEPKTIRDAFMKVGVSDPSLQQVGEKAEHFLVRFEQQKGADSQEGAEQFQKIRQVLSQELSSYEIDIQRVDFVGPLIGQELRKQGAMSLLWAILGIVVYIGLRFDMRFSPGAVAKMIQDLFVTLGFYVFFQQTFDLTSVAALLTVVGYSVNDTIVIFDRIRENLSLNPRRTFYENINVSINETLGRSINTSVATLVSLAGILIFATASIWDFGMAMAIGVVSATLSSTFISPTFLLWFEKLKLGKKVISA